MSEMEYRFGKIQKVKTDNVEEYADKILKEKLTEERYNRYVELYDTKLEFLTDELYNEYVLVNNELFKIIEDNSFDHDDYLAKAKQIDEDTFEYTLVYYNGGCEFNEALEDAMENLKD